MTAMAAQLLFVAVTNIIYASRLPVCTEVSCLVMWKVVRATMSTSSTAYIALPTQSPVRPAAKLAMGDAQPQRVALH